MNTGDTQLILAECKRQGLSRQHTAYVLATAKWETNHTMRPVKEAYWLSENWRAKNLRYYPWYGRGYVQLTWKENYEKAGRILGMDLTSDPNVVMQPSVAAKILVRGCKDGWFTGKKLSDYSTYEDMRRVVNGTDRAREIADIARTYEKALGSVPSTPTETEKGSIPAFVIALAAVIVTAAIIIMGGK